MEKSASSGHGLSREIREVILNSRKPLVMRRFGLKWKCFDITLEEWCRQYDEELNAATFFEMMDSKDGNKSPHWERKREVREMTTVQFLREQSTERGRWLALNYKRANDLPASVKEGIGFGSLGFSETFEDFNFWLGSKEANTPCHYDTYGCNIIVQIYGKKLWLLFPPEAPLTSTRIPYEESSIYCTENFFAPGDKEKWNLLKLKEFAYRCILEEGDILIVPKHWWHYVEALEVSLSINYWVPLNIDADAQIEECIVKFLIESFVRNGNQKFQKYVLNPNQLLQVQDEKNIFEILDFLYKTVTNEEPPAKLQGIIYPYHYLDEYQLKNVLNKLPKGMVEPVLKLTETEYEDLITTNSKRYNSATETSIGPPPVSTIKRSLINSICSPEVIKHIKTEFYKNYKF